MGDKGGKKGKHKSQKQKASKQDQKAKQKQIKQPSNKPLNVTTISLAMDVVRW